MAYAWSFKCALITCCERCFKRHLLMSYNCKHCIAGMVGSGKIWQIICGWQNMKHLNFSLSMASLWLKFTHSPNFFPPFNSAICQTFTLPNIPTIWYIIFMENHRKCHKLKEINYLLYKAEKMSVCLSASWDNLSRFCMD